MVNKALIMPSSFHPRRAEIPLHHEGHKPFSPEREMTKDVPQLQGQAEARADSQPDL